MESSHVIDLFVARGMIDQSLGEDILTELEHSGKDIGDLLSDFQIVGSKKDIWPVIASELGAELVDITKFDPSEALLEMIPAGMARLHGALPISFDDAGLTVVLIDPMNPQTAEDLRFALGQEIVVAVAPDHQIEQKINDLYGGAGKAMAELLDQLEGGGTSLSDKELGG